MAKYTSATKASDFAKVLTKLNACSEAMNRLYEDYPAQQLSIATLLNVCSTFPDQSWAIWVLKIFGQDMSTDLRQVLISKVTDSMMAFRLYLDFPWLTDEEDILLETKFKGKLPTAEKELADGIVKRSK